MSRKGDFPVIQKYLRVRKMNIKGWPPLSAYVKLFQGVNDQTCAGEIQDKHFREIHVFMVNDLMDF
jgi:hypothetical protein